MAHRQISMIVQVLRGLGRAPGAGDATDSQLLSQFMAHRDEAAFAGLLARYGPMVLGACRRVLGDTPDAEDAFQATFLVLARKATTLNTRLPLGNWLYTVAFNAARKARAATARRRHHELAAPVRPVNEEQDRLMIAELRAVLDEELHRLPEKYRAPVVLCYLEGKTNDEAAGQLGWSKGTVSGRLARARDLLRMRLSRRGVDSSSFVSGAPLGAAFSGVPVPRDLFAATARIPLMFAGGAAEGLPASVTILAEGALRAMYLSKIKTAGAIILVASAVCAGVGGLTHLVVAREQAGAGPAVQQTPAAENQVADLQRSLKTPNAAARAKAAAALGSLGQRAWPAVVALIYALKDEDAAVRQQAAIALGQIGPEAKAAVPVLLTTMRDKEPAVAVRAAQAAERIGLNDAKTRLDYVTALGALGKAAVPFLVPLLKEGEDLQVRHVAVRSLGDIGPEARAAVPELAKLVLLPPRQEEGDHPLGALAALALGRIGPAAAPAVPELLVVLKPDDVRMEEALTALGEIGPGARAALPILLPLLERNNGWDHRRVFWAVDRIDPSALDPALLERLVTGHTDEEVRLLAAEQLLRRNLRPPVVAARLTMALKSESSYVRRDTARLLGQVGPPAREAIPLLVAALADPNSEVRKAAAVALRSVDPENAGRIAVPRDELPPDVRSRADLSPYLTARRDGAQKAFEGRYREFIAGRGTLEMVFTYSRHWLESETAVRTKAVERIEAYQAHLQRMYEVEKINRLRYESGRIPIFDFTSSEFHRLEAEIWLAEENLKQP